MADSPQEQARTDHDLEAAPELAGLNLRDKPDGPGAAAILAAGIGVFSLGLFTTLAVPWEGFRSFMESFDVIDGVGPLAGKTTAAVIVWAIAWVIAAGLWRRSDVDLRWWFAISVVLGVLGAIGTFPPFFELFAE